MSAGANGKYNFGEEDIKSLINNLLSDDEDKSPADGMAQVTQAAFNISDLKN